MGIASLARSGHPDRLGMSSGCLLGREGTGKDLVVAEVYVQRKLIINTLHIESRHVADNTLQRSVNLHLDHEQVWIYLGRASKLLVFIVLRPAFYAERLATFVHIRIRYDSARVQTDFGVQPSVFMGRIAEMVFPKQHQVIEQCFRTPNRVGEGMLPIVEAAPLYPHLLTEEVNGKVT